MLNISIIGLGLIGASLAKSLKLNTNHTIFGYDISENVVNQALFDKTIDFALNDGNFHLSDIFIICLYPRDTINYVKENIKKFKKNTIIVDCAGVKHNICSSLSSLCFENSLHFVGGHPMAGIEKSGYNFSNPHLFDSASMVFCKDKFTSEFALNSLTPIFKQIGFLKITYSSSLEHDKVIAFTSQLAHVVSNAYVQSEQAKLQTGFSGGSYKDLTRVAYLNEFMWSELFIENKEPLVAEIRHLSSLLEDYAKLIETENSDDLIKLLRKGKEMKSIVG